MNSGKPCLTLITPHYPCKNSGDFFEDAIPFLNYNFDIKIISTDTQNDQTRTLPKGVTFTRMPELTKIKEFFYKIPFLFSGMFWRQIKHVQSSSALSLSVFSGILSLFAKSRHLADYLIEREEFNNKVPLMYYSFASSEYIFAPYFAKKAAQKNVKSIIRCRGIDIYRFEQNPSHGAIIPELDSLCDSIYFDCENRMKYFMKKYARKPTDPYKYMVARFGITDRYKPLYTNDRESGILHILTKNPQDSDESLYRFLDALALVTTGHIHWTHFGRNNALKETAVSALAGNEHITYSFEGELSYSDRMEFYQKNKIHCFVYLSTMPSLPFEIIETMSNKIFPIVLNIDGINELVNDKNGLIMPVDVTESELAKAISILAEMPEHSLEIKCEKAREEYLNSCTAEKNCKALATLFEEVLAE